eukprot:TRINITY_DN7020_c0_g1_i11.p1 TRINITY_DN7020_c0_g1~~TRINITY_DN7020_c0_g1_i11.p1  ORF type:complete len:428 (+),score=55.32 TRINITY_DN7020_c0_g1_i11:102-1385(+)
MRQEPDPVSPQNGTSPRYSGAGRQAHHRATDGAPLSAERWAVPAVATPGSEPTPATHAPSQRASSQNRQSGQRSEGRVLYRTGSGRPLHGDQSPGVGDYTGAYLFDSRGRSATVGAGSSSVRSGSTFGSARRSLDLRPGTHMQAPGVGAYSSSSWHALRARVDHSVSGSAWSRAPGRQASSSASVRSRSSGPLSGAAPAPHAQHAAAAGYAWKTASAPSPAGRRPAATRSRSAQSAPESIRDPATASSIWLQHLAGAVPAARDVPPPPPVSMHRAVSPPPATAAAARQGGPRKPAAVAPPRLVFRRSGSPLGVKASPVPRTAPPRRSNSRGRRPQPASDTAAASTTSAELQQLLCKLNLDGIYAVLMRNGYDSVAALSGATDQDLELCGVKRGHRARLLAALGRGKGTPARRATATSPDQHDRVLLD